MPAIADILDVDSSDAVTSDMGLVRVIPKEVSDPQRRTLR